MKKIYLIWQEFKDGSRHIRRYSPDGTFYGYQGQTEAALAWMDNNGHPEYGYDSQIEDDGLFSIEKVTPFEKLETDI